MRGRHWGRLPRGHVSSAYLQARSDLHHVGPARATLRRTASAAPPCSCPLLPPRPPRGHSRAARACPGTAMVGPTVKTVFWCAFQYRKCCCYVGVPQFATDLRHRLQARNLGLILGPHVRPVAPRAAAAVRLAGGRGTARRAGGLGSCWLAGGWAGWLAGRRAGWLVCWLAGWWAKRWV